MAPSTAGQGWIQGNPPRSHPECEELLLIQHKALQLPWKAPTQLWERLGLQQSRAEHCKDSSGKGKFHTEQREKLPAHHRAKQLHAGSAGHSILEHPGNREVPTQEPRSRRTRKGLVFASFTHPAPEFLMKGASAALRAGRKGRKSWNL